MMLGWERADSGRQGTRIRASKPESVRQYGKGYLTSHRVTVRPNNLPGDPVRSGNEGSRDFGNQYVRGVCVKPWRSERYGPIRACKAHPADRQFYVFIEDEPNDSRYIGQLGS